MDHGSKTKAQPQNSPLITVTSSEDEEQDGEVEDEVPDGDLKKKKGK
jgi:hypothetical protein